MMIMKIYTLNIVDQISASRSVLDEHIIVGNLLYKVTDREYLNIILASLFAG